MPVCLMAAVLRVGNRAAPLQATATAAVLDAEQAPAVQEAPEVVEVLAMVVVAGAAQAADVSYFSTIWSVIMKTSSLVLVALASALTLGSAAYAAGPHGGNAGMSAGNSASAGAQSRAGNPGVGTATSTQTQTRTLTPTQDRDQDKDQLHTRLQTPTADGVPAAGTGTGTSAGAGTVGPKGIHTPGTGLTTTSTDTTTQ